MRKSKKLLTFALVSSIASSMLVTPLAFASETEAIESSTSSVLLEKDTTWVGSEKITYEITKKGNIITYDLDQNGEKNIVTYNEKTKEFTLNGKVTTINSLLGISKSVKSIDITADIPSDVERTYPSPNGEIGQLVKDEESSTLIERSKISVMAVMLSQILPAPYSKVLNVLNALFASSTAISENLYMKIQHYVLTDGTARKFVLVKYYSDSAMRDLVDTSVEWEF